MALCTDPRMVHRETVAEVSICVYVSRVRVYNRAPPPPPPQLGDSARRRRWEDREEKGEKEGRKERGRRLGGRRWWGSSRGDANLMAAAINNKHRSLIARESSSLSIFLHLPFHSVTTRLLSRFFESRLSCIFHLPLSLSIPPRHRFPPGASLTPFILQRAFFQPSVPSFLLKRKVYDNNAAALHALFSLERPLRSCTYPRVCVYIFILYTYVWCSYF